MTDPVLTKQDRDSAVWLKLVLHLNARLATLRVKNDADMTPEKTARLRGRIEEVKALLTLGSDKPVVEDEDAKFSD